MQMRKIYPRRDGLKNLSNPPTIVNIDIHKCKTEIADGYRKLEQLFADKIASLPKESPLKCIRLGTDEAIRLLLANDSEKTCDGINLAIEHQQSGSHSGKLHKAQLYTAIETIDRTLSGRRHAIILGTMKCGKTSTFAALFFFEAIIRNLVTDKEYLSTIIVPNKNDINDETVSEFTDFLMLYENLYFENIETGKRLFVKHYSRETQKKLHTLGQCAYNPSKNIYKSSLYQIDEFNKTESIAREKGYETLTYVDEAHDGTDENGVKSRMITDSVYKTSHLRWISATPMEQLLALWDQSEIILHYLSPGFYGMDKLAIEQEAKDPMMFHLPGLDNYKPIHPKVYGYQDFFGCDNLYPEAYADIVEYLRKVKNYARRNAEDKKYDQKNICDHEHYKSEFIKNLQNIIYNLLISRTKINLSKENNSVGMMIRIGRNNSQATEIINLIQPFLQKNRIVPIQFFGSRPKEFKSDYYTVENIIKENNPQNNPYIVFVTGRARMAAKFPIDTRYFLDFTVDPSTATAAMQGTIGRACGVGKETAIFLHKNFADQAEKYIETGLWKNKQLHSRTGAGPGRPISSALMTVEDYTKYSEIISLVDRLEIMADKEINELLFKYNGLKLVNGELYDRKQKRRMWTSASRDDLKMMKLVDAIGGFTEQHPEELTTITGKKINNSVEILRYCFNKSLQIANSPYLTSNGEELDRSISRRNAGAFTEKMKASLETSRKEGMTSGMGTESDKSIRIQLVYRFEMKNNKPKVKIISIMFRLRSPLHRGGRSPVKINSFTHKWLTS